MLHLDFSDYSQVLKLAKPELPLCPNATIIDIASVVFARMCEETQCFRETVTFNVRPNERHYELVSPHQGTSIIGISEVRVDGMLLQAGDYNANSFNVIEMESNGNKCDVVLILKPDYDNNTAPSQLVGRWAKQIATGVKAELMASVDMPWSNPQMAGYHGQRFEIDLLKMAADVRNQFSVTRTGRASYNRSVFGV